MSPPPPPQAMQLCLELPYWPSFLVEKNMHVLCTHPKMQCVGPGPCHVRDMEIIFQKQPLGIHNFPINCGNPPNKAEEIPVGSDITWQLILSNNNPITQLRFALGCIHTFAIHFFLHVLSRSSCVSIGQPTHLNCLPYVRQNSACTFFFSISFCVASFATWQNTGLQPLFGEAFK